MCVSDDLKEEFHSVMLHDNMEISCLMVHVKQVDKTILKRNNREFKRAKAYEEGNLKGKLEIQDKPMFKKKFSNKFPSKFPMDIKDKVSNPRSHGERS